MIGDHQGRGEATTLALASGVQHVVKAGLPPLVEHHKYILQSSMIGLKYHIVEHVNQREVLLSWKNTSAHELQVATALQKSVGVAHAIKVNR